MARATWTFQSLDCGLGFLTVRKRDSGFSVKILDLLFGFHPQKSVMFPLGLPVA